MVPQEGFSHFLNLLAKVQQRLVIKQLLFWFWSEEISCLADIELVKQRGN